MVTGEIELKETHENKMFKRQTFTLIRSGMEGESGVKVTPRFLNNPFTIIIFILEVSGLFSDSLGSYLAGDMMAPCPICFLLK